MNEHDKFSDYDEVELYFLAGEFIDSQDWESDHLDFEIIEMITDYAMAASNAAKENNNPAIYEGAWLLLKAVHDIMDAHGLIDDEDRQGGGENPENGIGG